MAPDKHRRAGSPSGPARTQRNIGKVAPMGKTILIVDDSSIMRKMIKETLKSAGHDVIGEAKNGSDAVALYKTLDPDLVTMDITMRGMDGFEAARQILSGDREACIIFLSNLDEAQYSQEAKQIGAKGYLNKHRSKDILTLIEQL
jgi:two-component system chemotaxis response regulator CheY